MRTEINPPAIEVPAKPGQRATLLAYYAPIGPRFSQAALWADGSKQGDRWRRELDPGARQTLCRAITDLLRMPIEPPRGRITPGRIAGLAEVRLSGLLPGTLGTEYVRAQHVPDEAWNAIATVRALLSKGAQHEMAWQVSFGAPDARLIWDAAGFRRPEPPWAALEHLVADLEANGWNCVDLEIDGRGDELLEPRWIAYHLSVPRVLEG